MPEPKPHLAYTVAIDPPGQTGCRLMAKMLAASLSRTQFFGNVMIFHNSSAPIFFLERKGVEEINIEPETPEDRLELAEEAWKWKYRVRKFIDAERYDKILFLDADCLALRNLDHLLDGEWDIAFQRERGLNIQMAQFQCFLTNEERRGLKIDGVNSGTLAVRGSIFQEVMAEWERIDESEPPQPRFCSDQASWNRLLLDHCSGVGSLTGSRGKRWKAQPFEEGEIMFPMHLHKDFREHRNAAILHFLGGSNLEKMQHMFALYMATFFHDPAGTLLNVTDM
jgi:hypothetical protein